MTTNNTSSSTSTRRVNPFGDAKPREAVLASKGVDYRTIDTRLDEKAKTEQQHGDTATAAAAAAAESYHEPQRYHNEYHFHRDRGEYHSQSMNGGGEGGRGRLTPSQAIHPPSAHHAHFYSHYSHNSPRHHRYSFDKDNNDNDDDEYTHETASVSTIHTHLSHHTCTLSTQPHSSPSANPFGDARPREEVLADKGIDAKEVDSKIEQQVLEKEVVIHTENLVALNHPGGPARSTSTSPYATKTAQTQNPTKQKKKKINPFGDAKPREIVLANKGVDYRNVDKILDRKIAAEHLTHEQDAEAESIRLALSKAEDAYWDANEKELPEEDLRLDMEAKRKELHDLLEKFQEINLRKKREESSSSSTSTSTDKVDKKEGSSTRAEQSKEKKNALIMRPPEKAQTVKRWNITFRDGQVDTTIAQQRTSNKTEDRPTVAAPLLYEAKAMKNTTVAMRDDIQTLNVRGMQARIAILIGMSLVLTIRTEAVEPEVTVTIEVGEDVVDGVGDMAAAAAADQVADIPMVEMVTLAMVAIAAPIDGNTTIMTNMTIVRRDENTGR